LIVFLLEADSKYLTYTLGGFFMGKKKLFNFAAIKIMYKKVFKF